MARRASREGVGPWGLYVQRRGNANLGMKQRGAAEEAKKGMREYEERFRVCVLYKV